MDINKFDVVVWVRKTRFLPDLARGCSASPVMNQRVPATRAWSIFTGASSISPTPSTWPLLWPWPPGPTWSSELCNYDNLDASVTYKEARFYAALGHANFIKGTLVRPLFDQKMAR